MQARRVLLFLITGSLLGGWPSSLAAAPRVHALVIGNNTAFPASGVTNDDASSTPLHYADDDAAAVFELLSEATNHSHLLTLMDARSQALFPDLVALARVPTLDAVRQAVQQLAYEAQEDITQGHTVSVIVFYSGHGALSFEGEPALALADGPMHRAFLYDEVLARLPVATVHLIVDACHAEAVVRPREDAEVVPVEPEEAQRVLFGTTLRRFPHVGAIMAASNGAQAHEWDTIGHGVFTHELLSALRGAADVNRDRRLEYSEVVAFMSAANRSVREPRARLQVVARPPSTNQRAALLDWTGAQLTHAAWLVGFPGIQGRVRVHNDTGRSILTLYGAEDYVTDLLLPIHARILRDEPASHARFDASAGGSLDFAQLQFTDEASHPRGFERALREGLFATPFGRGYYMGFVDHSPGFTSVDFPPERAHLSPEPDRTTAPAQRTELATLSTYRLVGGAALSHPIARGISFNQGAHVGLQLGEGSGARVGMELMIARERQLTESIPSVTGGYTWATGRGPLAGWAGAVTGGGMIVQDVEGAPSLTSPLLLVAPVVGGAAELNSRINLLIEFEGRALGYRSNHTTKLSFVPWGWVGVGVDL